MYELNKIYLGNAYELIKQIPDHSIDLIITDPPYDMAEGGTGKNELSIRYRKQYQELQDNGLDVGMDLSILKEFERVCKKIYIYIWCNKNLLFDLITYYHNRTDDVNVNMDLIVWGKSNPMPLCNNFFLNDCEYCLCIHEKGIGWNTSAGYDAKKKCYYMEVNKLDKDLYNHPTIKPLKIIKNFILNSSAAGGGVILDPFIGSGTTAAAAKELGRNYIGFEINEKYYNIAVDRLNGVTQKEKRNKYQQISLF